VSNRIKTKSRGQRVRTNLLVGGGAALALLGVMSAADAAIPNANGRITGCYTTSTGALRVISGATGHCSRHEKRLVWNLTGAQGAVGPQGVTGRAGANGTPGPAGANGTRGPAGANGATGAAGATGPMGATGSVGPIGSQGPSGATGTTGAAGPAGPVGPAGTAGTNGIDGTDGTDGYTVLAGGGSDATSSPFIPFDAIASSSTESVVSFPVPAAGTLSSLQVEVSAAPGTTTGGGARSLVMTVRKNGANTSLVCTVTGSATSCSDPSDTVAFAAGDTLDLQLVPTAFMTPVGNLTWSVKLR
jgi:hypothetical protein